MRTKRVLSMLLSLIMILGLMVTPTFAETSDTVTAYLNVSQYGEIVKDKSDNALALAPVELTGKESYTLDDVFKALHDSYYDGGAAAGYTSADGTYGLYITEFWGDESGKVTLSFDAAGTYIVSATKGKTVSEKSVTAITAPICIVNVSDCPDTAIAVPSDATLFVGTKGKTHFVKFTEIEPTHFITSEDTTTYYFELTDNSTYNYRVSGEEYITYGGTFKKTADFTMSVTEEQLKPTEKTKTTIDRNTASNGGYNVADIYLNINPQGYLKLEKDDTFQIVSLRNWEAVNNTSSNYFIEPDYHYEVIDENGNASDVAAIDKNGLLTAKKSGTAVVLVTYDAMTLNFGTSDNFYGAIYPENTGVFVVSVDSENSEIETGMTVNEGKNESGIKLSGDNIDSEHDCIYYIGEQGEYTFTPACEDVKVYVANPVITNDVTYNGFTEITKNDDSFSIPLSTGRNIVKLEKDGKAEYQIITAKKVDVTINNGEAVLKGDTVSIVFDKLYHPANKLAGVYNMNAIAVYTNVSGYDGQIIGAASAQYNFVNNSSAQTVANILIEKNVWGVANYVKSGDLIIPNDYPYDTFTLSGGTIYTSGWGDSYGNHRAITYENGKGANLNAAAKLGYLAKLPDVEIPVVATTSALASITLNTEKVKTDYFAGDKFDTTGLVVTANYEDETTQIATNYSVSPEILSADTEKVTVAYKGKTAEIPVTVTNPKITAIEIAAPPTKTTYKEGETFNPSGMIVTAVYENGAKKEITEYSYSPNREFETSDTEMTISYTGENAADDIENVTQQITVTEKSTGGGNTITSNKITVYFTLLGDDKHGTPSGSNDTHTKKKGNLDTWISKTKITLDKGSYVIDAVEKALSLNGTPYTSDDNYISEIKGLAEFDNGSLSGWMYMLNGKYPTKGIDEQKLSNGDAIIFHYTDDYTTEITGYSSSNGTSSSVKPKDDDTTKEETTKTEDAEKKDETTVTQKPSFSEETYSDVKSDEWYYEAVKFAYENDLMHGTDKGFEPDSKMTRAMLITVLWRMENEPVVNFLMTFDDVDSKQWYTEAIRWAASENIISGIGNNLLGTNDEITREQMATILYRYVQKKNIDTQANRNTSIKDYEDCEAVSDYAVAAMEWAVDFGIIKGKTKTTISSADSATRAEVATMLMRFYEGISE